MNGEYGARVTSDIRQIFDEYEICHCNILYTLCIELSYNYYIVLTGRHVLEVGLDLEVRGLVVVVGRACKVHNRSSFVVSVNGEFA